MIELVEHVLNSGVILYSNGHSTMKIAEEILSEIEKKRMLPPKRLIGCELTIKDSTIYHQWEPEDETFQDDL